MFLPAHDRCNRNIKSEHNPFVVVPGGTINADLQKMVKDDTTYENIIEEAIDYEGKLQGLSGDQLKRHKSRWIGIQEGEFDKIAGFLNTVDNMTKTASLQIIRNMWISISNNGNDREIRAFKDFITYLLPPMGTTGDNLSIIENILKHFSDPISENLSLLHKKILARFTFCIHKPVIAESPPRIGTTDVNPNRSGDTQHSAYSEGSSPWFSSVAVSPASVAASPASVEAHSQLSFVEESPANARQQKGGKGGGKRTKRRRGRGKSKKKVTRKKRVKRRKTVKKIKRKRRRTRKR